MQPIVLFDVDGTLVWGSFLHVRALISTLKNMFDITFNIKKNQFAGKTDKQIIIELLLDNGLQEEVIRNRMNDIINNIADFYIKHIDEETGHVLPGVNEILDILDKKGAHIGLVTGNISEIAYLKIQKVGVKYKFRFDGFDTDDCERSELINCAIQKAVGLYNLDIEEAQKNTFYIGDTPRDVKASKEAGVKSIAVGTGSFQEKDFESDPPDLYIKSFEEKRDIERLLSFLGLD